MSTTVNGACVLEKKHIAIGPNKGNMDNVEPPIDVGDGPSRKSVKGDAISVIGEITNVTVSKTDDQICHFSLLANLIKLVAQFEMHLYLNYKFT